MKFLGPIVAAAAAGPVLATPLPRIGMPAPPATIRMVDGQALSLASLHGQVVILNYWATWCVPCRKELPLLDSFYRVTAPYGLRVFAATTEGSVPISQLKPLFAAMAITPVRRIEGKLGTISAVPTNIVVDRAGIVRYAKAGAFDLDELNAILIPLLREPAPPSAVEPGAIVTAAGS